MITLKKITIIGGSGTVGDILFERLQNNYDVLVLDKNIKSNTSTHRYVFSMSVRGAHKELKEYVKSESGYQGGGEQYKRKSRLYPRDIYVTANDHTKIKKQVHEKQVVFWRRNMPKKPNMS